MAKDFAHEQVKLIHDDATMPERGSPYAVGFDVTSVEFVTIHPKEQKLVNIGLAVACPTGTYARIAPRSGLALKHNLSIGAGVIDADHRGEVGILLINNGTAPCSVAVGEQVPPTPLGRYFLKKCPVS